MTESPSAIAPDGNALQRLARRRRLERWLALLLGLPTGALLLAVLLSRLGALDGPLRAALAALSDRIGGRIEPSQVRLGLFPPRLYCAQLKLFAPVGDRLLLELEGLDLRALPGGAALKVRGGTLMLDPAWRGLGPKASDDPEGLRPATLGFGLAVSDLRLVDGQRLLGRLALYASRRPWPNPDGGSGGLRFEAEAGGDLALSFEWDGTGQGALMGRFDGLEPANLWPEQLLGPWPGATYAAHPGAVSGRGRADWRPGAVSLDWTGEARNGQLRYGEFGLGIAELRLGLDLELSAQRVSKLTAWSAGRADIDLGDALVPVLIDGQAQRSTPGDAGSLQLDFEVPDLPLDARLAADLAQRLNRQGLRRTGRELENAVQGLDPGGFVRALGSGRWRGLEQPALERLAVEFQPAGRMDLRYVGWPEESGDRHGFPVRARELTGRVVLGVEPQSGRGFELGLFDIVGQHSSGQVLGNGWLGSRLPSERGLRRDPRVLLRLEVPEMAVGPEMFEGLAGLGAGFELERILELDAGQASAVVRLDGSSTAPGIGVAVEAQFEGLSGRVRELPAPFRDAAGALALRYTAQAFPAVPNEGQRRGREVGLALAARGLLEGTPPAPVAFHTSLRQERLTRGSGDWRDFKLAVEGLPLPSLAMELALAREADARAAAERFQPNGSLDVLWQRHDPPTGAASERLTVESAGVRLSGLGDLDLGAWAGRALLERQPERAQSGAEPSTGPSADLRALFGAQTAGRGALLARARLTPELNLDLDWDGARLSDPGLARLAGQANEGGDAPVLGPFDVRARLRPGSEPEAELWLRHNSLALDRFQLTDLDGQLVLSPRGLRGEKLEGRLERTPVVLRDLELRPPDSAGKASVSGRLWVKNLPLDAQHLAPWLSPEQLSALLEGARWRGSLDVLGAEFRAARDAAGQVEAEISGPFVPHDVYLEAGIPLRIGSARLEVGQLFFESGRLRGFANISELYGSVAQRSLADLSGVLSFSDGRLLLEDVRGQFCAGKLSSRNDGAPLLLLDLAPPYPFELGLNLEGASLRELLRELFPGQLGNRGELDLNVRLAGRPAEALSLEAEGDLRLFNARLWSVPVVRELFGALGYDATATFDWMSTDFRLSEGRIELANAVAHSPLFNLVGGGSLDLNGTLDQTYTISYGLVDRLGFLSRLFYFFQDRVVRIRISGDMGRPQVRLMNALVRLFGSQPDRTPRLALPVPRGLPERF